MAAGYEESKVRFEAARNTAMDDWFNARPHISRTRELEMVFEGGFRLAWGATRREALAEAAAALEAHDRKGREWVPGSLWDTLSREGAARIRALEE